MGKPHRLTRVEHMSHQYQTFLETVTLPQSRLQRFPADELLSAEQRAVRATCQLEDVDDARMVQRGDQSYFPEETSRWCSRGPVLLLIDEWRQFLERHLATDDLVARSPDDALAPAS